MLSKLYSSYVTAPVLEGFDQVSLDVSPLEEACLGELADDLDLVALGVLLCKLDGISRVVDVDDLLPQRGALE